MNLWTRFFFIVLVFFISMPTLITLIEKKPSTFVFFDMDSEEIHDQFDDFHDDVKIYFNFPFSISNFNTKAKINSSNLFFYIKLSEKVFSPPPEFS